MTETPFYLCIFISVRTNLLKEKKSVRGTADIKMAINILVHTNIFFFFYKIFCQHVFNCPKQIITAETLENVCLINLLATIQQLRK